MIKKLSELLLILVFSLSPLLGIQDQERPASELVALSRGNFNAPLELIASQSFFLSGHRMEAVGQKNLQLLSRRFQIDMDSGEPEIAVLVQVKKGDTSELEKAGFFKQAERQVVSKAR